MGKNGGVYIRCSQGLYKGGATMDDHPTCKREMTYYYHYDEKADVIGIFQHKHVKEYYNTPIEVLIAVLSPKQFMGLIEGSERTSEQRESLERYDWNVSYGTGNLDSNLVSKCVHIKE
tara:strand:+ start:4368 stop:4721 length:354 start_codon:yes stop_codon:yes gene_type:complete